MTTMVYLVRHAKAMRKKEWSGTDIGRPLDEKGIWQAPQIAERLIDKINHVERVHLGVYASPSMRCRQTLDPFADKVGLPIRTSVLLGDLRSGPPRPPDIAGERIRKGSEPARRWLGTRGLAFIDEVVGAHENGHIIACSHGDLIYPTLDLVFARDGTKRPSRGNEKGSMWTLTFDASRLESASYQRAP